MDAETPRSESLTGPGSSQFQGTKLFLGGLSWETSEDKLRQYFAKYGDVMEVIVMKERLTNKPRGFGFITFKDASMASRACADVHTVDGRTIDAKPSFPQSEGSKPRSKKIFVGGLAPDTSEEQFTTYFKQFGTILEAQIMQDHTSGRSRGFGFVTFENETAVDKVFSAGSMHDLNGKKVEVKNATPKGSGPQGLRVPGRGAAGSAGTTHSRGYHGASRFGEYGQYTGYGMGASFAMTPGIIGYGPSYPPPYPSGPYGAPYGSMMIGPYSAYFGGPYGSSPYAVGQSYSPHASHEPKLTAVHTRLPVHSSVGLAQSNSSNMQQ